MKVTKLVLPVAGLGKRLLPLTKSVPKNLVPVCGRPLLEYVLDEAVQSGIIEVILIVNPKHKKNFELYLRRNKKNFPSLKFHIREQATPGGNGHAIAQAHDLLDGEPFAVRFCDDVIMAKRPVLTSLLDIFRACRKPVLLLERIPKKDVSRFGVVGVKKISARDGSALGGKSNHNSKIYQITKIIEKPKFKDAPSNLIIVGGYVLTPAILRNLKSVVDTLPIIANDALPLAVALQIELILRGKVYGWEFDGMRLDCGTLEKFKKAEEYLKKNK